MEEKKQLSAWIKSHQKKLIIAGISVTTVALIVLVMKNKDSLKKLYSSVEDRIKKDIVKDEILESVTDHCINLSTTSRAYTRPQNTFDVTLHTRKLPEGYHHSAKKAAEAVRLGIDLLPNETIVDSYLKYAVA